ncbi:MAG: helix-turn-helix transcriptional regulator [Solirubrobacterales bacterium]|nr:helix-turn-helix transcriptional regulator [Solirubrobacterales bacterium]
MDTLNGHSANGNGAARAIGNGPRSIPVDWEHLARATAHPLRVSILEILGLDGGRTLSPSDLSQELQIPLSNTNYHVTELHKADLIVLVRQRQVRGATEHFYRLQTQAPATNGNGLANGDGHAAETPLAALEPALHEAA